VNAGERRAARHYRLRGWRVVGANVRVGRDEIDLIVRRGRRLRFVEVKQKTGFGYGSPLEMIDRRKTERVGRAARRWLALHPQAARLQIGFDAVGVGPDGLTRVPLEQDGSRS
jgi:putative endonuclease